jgi:hypothetical protein
VSRRCAAPQRPDAGGHGKLLLIADTPWQIRIAGMASALVLRVKCLGERDVRIAG